jgi:multiple sugar transport system substrate-binding protein
MKMKALIFILISIIIVVGLAACSQSGTNNNSEPEKNASDNSSNSSTNNSSKNEGSSNNETEEISLRFTWWGDAKRHDKYNAIADLYQELNPHVEIVREFGSWGDYWDKLATQTAGGNAPDIIGMHATYVADYARRNTLLDLSSYIEDGTVDISNFPPAVQGAGKVNGTTVMVAQGVTMTGWEYNSGMFDDLNVEYPDYDWTWEDFKAKLAELKEAISEPGVWPSVDDSGEITSVQVFARQRGTDLFTEEGKLGVTVDDMKAWFSMWDEFRQAEMIPDAATTEQYLNVTLDQGLFVKGKVALDGFPFNQIPLYQNYITNGEVHALRRPSIPGGEEGEFIEGSYLAVSSTSEHPKEAAAFISFFVNNEEAVKIFKIEQGAYGSTKANELITPLLAPPEQRTIEAIDRSLKTAGQLPLPPAGQGEVRSLLLEVAQSIAFGQRTVEEGAQYFVDQTTAILNK